MPLGHPLWDQSSNTNRVVRTKDVLGIAPHFEKMLYDNAQLARVYLHVWQVTGEPFYRSIVEETLDYIVREMTCVGTSTDTQQLRLRPQLPSDSAAKAGGIAGFYDTSDGHETLVVRPRELQDNAVPSGNAMAALVLVRLAGLAIEPRYLELALAALGPMQEMLARYPLGFGQWLIAFDYVLAHPREASIVGDAEAADTQALLEVCADGYRPHQIVAFGEPGVEPAAVPLLEGRGLIDGRATAYVCVDFVCQRPVTEPEGLLELIEQAPRA